MWIVRQQDTRRSREGNTIASRRRVVSTMPKKYFPKVCGCLTFIYINFKLSAHFNKFIYPLVLVHLSQRLKCTIVITRCPSSVRRPSLTFHMFGFSSETAERNSTKLDRKQDLNVLYQVCVFRADRKYKMATLASVWLRHFRLLLWNRRTEFNETRQEARSQRPLPSLCFSGRLEKQDGCTGLGLAETFSTSLKKLLNGIQQNLTVNKISTSSTKFVFFGPIGKTRWLPLIGCDIFDFSPETAECNSTKLDRKQDLNVFYQVYFFSGRSGKQDGRLGLWWAEAFTTSLLKRLNIIQWNLTGSEISRSSTKFVFFGLTRKTRWLLWPIPKKGCTLYSGARYVALWASCSF